MVHCWLCWPVGSIGPAVAKGTCALESRCWLCWPLVGSIGFFDVVVGGETCPLESRWLLCLPGASIGPAVVGEICAVGSRCWLCLPGASIGPAVAELTCAVESHCWLCYPVGSFGSVHHHIAGPCPAVVSLVVPPALMIFVPPSQSSLDVYIWCGKWHLR